MSSINSNDDDDDELPLRSGDCDENFGFEAFGIIDDDDKDSVDFVSFEWSNERICKCQDNKYIQIEQCRERERREMND